MSKLSRGIGAAILCLGMVFSASVIMAMQDPPMKPGKETRKRTLPRLVEQLQRSRIRH